MQTKTKPAQEPAKARPAHEIRIGFIKATVWRNDRDERVRYSTHFKRIYKEKDGDQWKATEYFNREDLLLLAKVADQVHTWICCQGQEE